MSNETRANPQERYDAFISYRHIDPDRYWAKWLHRGLETYRVPRAIQRQGTSSRLSRVFRDEDELEAGSDLGEKLTTALTLSKYLVVVCSPRTRESNYVRQEVDYFVRHKGSDNVLLLLIEGEPSEAFPELLLSVGKEPLAADVRPQSLSANRQAKRLALLKLLAGILSCRFDDLRQRDLERQRARRLTVGAVATAVCLLLVALLAFALNQRHVAQSQQQLAKQHLAQAVANLEFGVKQVRNSLLTTARKDPRRVGPLESRELQRMHDELHQQVDDLNRLIRDTNAEPDKNLSDLLAQADWHLATITRVVRSPEEALPMFQSAARHFESNSTDDRFSAYVPELYLEWGGALAESNRGSDAVAVLQKGVDRLDVENRDSLTLARLHNNVGLAHLACDDNEKALSAFAMAETVLDRLEDATSPEDSAMLTEIAFERALVVLNQSQIHRLNREWDAGIDVLSRAASALEARTQSDARLADDEEFVRVLGLLYRNLGMMQLPRVGPLETVRTLSKSESLLSRLPTNSAPDQVSLAQCLSSLALAELMAHETGAEAHAKRAISIFEKLQEDKVAIAHLDGELASACLALGMEKLMRFEDEEAMGWFDKAAVHGERNYENDQSQQTRRNLLGVYHGRSLALTRLLRFDAAVDDLTKALQIAERESPVYVWLPVQLQVSRAGTDEYQDALKQLPSVLEGLEVPAAQDYMAACAYAAASRKASVDRRIIEQERSARAEEYAIQAVEFLSKAQKAGYFAKESDSPGVKPLHEDSLFALLRDRPDFQGLLKGVSLLWRLEKGKIVRFRATMNQRATIDAQKEIVTRAIYDVTWKVEMVDDEGIANVTVTIDRVRSQRLSGDKVEDEFDSKTGKRFRGLQGVTLNYMLSQYVGSTVKFRMAPTGQKTHFTWSGPIDELNVPGVQGTDLKAVLAGVLFRDVSVSSVPLPPGESWRCEIGEQTEDIFALADGKCVFDGVIANGDSRMAKITFQLRRPNDQAEGGGSMTFDEFEGEGEQLMDLDSGLLDRFVVHKMAAFRMRKDGETHSARTDNSVMIEKVEPDAEE